MENFTPVSGFTGGILIGAAASLLLLVNGRIAGISGILGGTFDSKPDGILWRLAFVAGIFAGPIIVGALGGPVPTVTPQASVPLTIIGGLLVGYGTRLGNGCTSGHGVCGIARGSMRSFVATAVFFVFAAATVFIVHHVIGGES